MYGMFFSVCVAVKVELLMQLLFIIPFFVILALRKHTEWRNFIYFCAGAVPVTFLRAVNSYIKYGVVRLEETMPILSILAPEPVLYDGLFSSYRGIVYTSPVLILSILGFALLFFETFKRAGERNKSENLQCWLVFLMGFYAVFKLVFVGMAFTTTGHELSMRVMLTEIPVFVILMAVFFKSLSRKVFIFFAIPAVVLGILWNLMNIAEYLTGIELLFPASGHPPLMARAGLIQYALGLFSNFNHIALKLKVLFPLVAAGIIFYLAWLLIRKNFKPSGFPRSGRVKLLSFFTVYCCTAYAVASGLNIYNNSRNVEELKDKGFLEEARVIEVPFVEFTLLEEEFRLLLLFNYMRYLAFEGEFQEYKNRALMRRRLYGKAESSIATFHKQEKPFQRIADFYRKSGRFDKVIEFHEKMLAFVPEDIPTLINMGHIYEKQGEYVKAAESYKKALEINPESVNAPWLLANLYWRLSEHEKTLYYLKLSLENNPSKPHIHSFMGSLHNELGRYEEALHYFKKALDYPFQDRETLKQLGDVYFSKGDYQKAIEHYSPARNAEVLMNKGNAYRELGMLEEALESYSRAVKMNPRVVHGFRGMADIYRDLSDYDNAVDYYRKVLDLTPRDLNVLVSLGDIFFEKGKYDRAAEYYRKTTEIAPRVASNYRRLAEIYRAKGEYVRAIENYEEAIKHRAVPAEDHRELGYLYIQLMQYEKAKENFSRAYYYRPSEPRSAFQLGYIHMELGEYEKASDYLNKVIELQPYFIADAHMMLGEIYISRNEPEKAEVQIKELKRLNRQDMAEILEGRIAEKFDMDR